MRLRSGCRSTKSRRSRSEPAKLSGATGLPVGLHDQLRLNDCVNTILSLAAKKLIPPNFQPRCIDFYAKYKYTIIKFHCPFCEKRFSHLLPAGYYLPVLKERQVVGAGYRLHALCPGCGCTDRERLVYLYLKTKTDVFRRPIKLLHVAPEANLQRVFKSSPNIDYLDADLDPAKAMIRMDISDIHYDDNTFDVIVCNHVLEHVPDDAKAMSELHRVMKPGGWGIFQVPISQILKKTFEEPSIKAPEQREKVFGQDDHVRIYGGDYVKRLQRAGFRVEVYRPRGDLGFLAIYRYALFLGEEVFAVHRDKPHAFR